MMRNEDGVMVCAGCGETAEQDTETAAQFVSTESQTDAEVIESDPEINFEGKPTAKDVRCDAYLSCRRAVSRLLLTESRVRRSVCRPGVETHDPIPAFHRERRTGRPAGRPRTPWEVMSDEHEAYFAVPDTTAVEGDRSLVRAVRTQSWKSQF